MIRPFQFYLISIKVLLHIRDNIEGGGIYDIKV